MATITILSREVVVNINTSWIFYISEVDANAIIADHYSFTLTLLSGVVHPSLPSAPWSELYSGLSMDLFGSGWNVTDNGSGDWSINFIVEIGNPNFTNIGDWYNFEVNTTTPITPTTGGGNQIKLYWNGAIDDNGISGYQIQWRTSTTSPWSQPPILVSHNPNSPGNTPTSGGGSYSHTITQVRDHTFRIRIIDSVGQFSAYKTITVSVDTSTILISTRNSQLNDNLVCGFPVINSILLKDNNGVATTTIINNLTFVKNSDNTTFNGLGRFWRILLNNISYRCKIDTSGKIESHLQCSSFTVKTFSISSQGYDSNITNGPICGADLNPTIYFNNELVIGTIIYTTLNENGTLTDIFIGGNRYYLISDFDFYYIIQIQNNGSVSSIQDYTAVCQLNDPIDILTCCFVKGTKITMFDYTTKNIEDVKIGDIIITYNEETKLQEPGEVVKVVSPMRSDIVEYELSSGVSIKSTTCHPYWVVNKGWSSFNPEITKKLYNFDVEQIEESDILLNIDNEEVIVDKITELITKKVITYNLGIMGNHTYYANNILVHNKTDDDLGALDECIQQIDENDGFFD